MTFLGKLFAGAALLATLGGCAGMSSWMPNWTPNAPADSMQNPAIYTQPADG